MKRYKTVTHCLDGPLNFGDKPNISAAKLLGLNRPIDLHRCLVLFWGHQPYSDNFSNNVPTRAPGIRTGCSLKQATSCSKDLQFLGLTPPAGCAVWDQIWEREDLIAFASSYHDSMLGLC